VLQKVCSLRCTVQRAVPRALSLLLSIRSDRSGTQAFQSLLHRSVTRKINSCAQLQQWLKFGFRRGQRRGKLSAFSDGHHALFRWLIGQDGYGVHGRRSPPARGLAREYWELVFVVVYGGPVQNCGDYPFVWQPLSTLAAAYKYPRFGLYTTLSSNQALCIYAAASVDSGC
jgi:hypothetical protein